jgi:hypothetical protein
MTTQVEMRLAFTNKACGKGFWFVNIKTLYSEPLGMTGHKRASWSSG